MSKSLVGWFALWCVLLCTLVLGACTPPKPSAALEPTIEAAPLGQNHGPWKIIAPNAPTLRLTVKPDPPLWVDINYDTQVIEASVLHLYPDVYQRNKDDLAKLRAELSGNGLTNLDEAMLKQMLGRVSRKQEFAVSLADFKAGRALASGRQLPLIEALEPKPEA